MSKKDHKHQHPRHKDENNEETQARHSGDLIDYDPEKAQDLIDVEEAARESDAMSHPNPDDPQHSKHSTPPGQENVPSGFTTGRGMQGGSANRRKR